MEISHHLVKNTIVVDLSENDGRLVTADIDHFIDGLEALAERSGGVIAFNMGPVTYLNSSGLGELIKIKDNLSDRGISLVLIGITNRVQSLISMVGVDQFFNIIRTEEELG